MPRIVESDEMTAAIENLKPALESLSADELAELARWIGERLEPEADDALFEELERRRIAFENGSSPSRPAADVIRDLRASFA